MKKLNVLIQNLRDVWKHTLPSNDTKGEEFNKEFKKLARLATELSNIILKGTPNTENWDLFDKVDSLEARVDIQAIKLENLGQELKIIDQEIEKTYSLFTITAIMDDFKDLMYYSYKHQHPKITLFSWRHMMSEVPKEDVSNFVEQKFHLSREGFDIFLDQSRILYDVICKKIMWKDIDMTEFSRLAKQWKEIALDQTYY